MPGGSSIWKGTTMDFDYKEKSYMLVRGPGTGAWILLVKNDSGNYNILLKLSASITEAKIVETAKGQIDAKQKN